MRTPPTDLARRLRAAGYTQARLGALLGVGQTYVGMLLRGELTPTHSDGSWRDMVWGLSSILHCEPEEIFGHPPVEEVEVETADLEADVWQQIELERLLSILRPRWRYVVEARMAGVRYVELAAEFQRTLETVRQLETKAVRRMWSRQYRITHDWTFDA